MTPEQIDDLARRMHERYAEAIAKLNEQRKLRDERPAYFDTWDSMSDWSREQYREGVRFMLREVGILATPTDERTRELEPTK